MKQTYLNVLAIIARVAVVLAFLFVPLPTIRALGPESGPGTATQASLNASISVPGVYFVHKASDGIIIANATFIDHPLTNGNPTAIIFVTQNQNPGGIDGNYHPHRLGVWYSTFMQQWAIFNQDLSPMISSPDFNVFIPDAGTNVFTHTATLANTSGNYTDIDHPRTNNKPYAKVLVTQNYNPGGGGGTYNDNPIGVWYNAFTHKWSIFNQNKVSMPNGASFNVFIPESSAVAFVHKATAGNLWYLGTLIDHPLTNNNPHAFVFATQNWNPGGVGGTYNTFPISVRYSKENKKWAVVNETVIQVPTGAAFNIVVIAFNVYLPSVLR